MMNITFFSVSMLYLFGIRMEHIVFCGAYQQQLALKNPEALPATASIFLSSRLSPDLTPKGSGKWVSLAAATR